MARSNTSSQSSTAGKISETGKTTCKSSYTRKHYTKQHSRFNGGHKRLYDLCFRCGSFQHLSNSEKCRARREVCNRCERTGHRAEVCLSKAIKIIDQDCSHCGAEDHNTFQCNFCYFCQRYGHHFKYCNNNKYIDFYSDFNGDNILGNYMKQAEEILTANQETLLQNCDMDDDMNITPRPSPSIKDVSDEEDNITAVIKKGPTDPDDLLPTPSPSLKDVSDEEDNVTAVIKEDPTDPDDLDSANENLWTCVYHGRDPYIHDYKGDVIIVKHNEENDVHYHFVFKSLPRNRRRTIERMHSNLNMNNINELILTCQPVMDWNKFAPYLIRKSNFKSWLLGKKLSDLYKYMQNTDPNERDCAEMKRMERKQKQTGVVLHRKQRTDVLMDFIRDCDARQLNQLKNYLTSNQRLSLYHEFGIQWQETAKLCIEVYNEELLREQKSVCFEQYIQRKLHSPCEMPTDYTTTNEWIDHLLLSNGINKYDFISAVNNVMNKTIDRKNTLLIEGPTTTGKSLILKLICANYNYGTVQRSGDHSQFFLQNLMGKSVALMEEPRITAITVNDFKELLGGSEFDIHVKHQDDVRLDRIPVLISSNHDLGDYIDRVDREAIYMRCFAFKFTKQIGLHLTPPPVHLCSCHFANWYLENGGFNKQ